MWDPYAEFETTVLPNGLTVHCSHWPNRTFQIFGFVVHSGANQDPDEKDGLAHFVEHVVSKNGCENRLEMRKFFMQYGDFADFGTTNDLVTKYTFILPNKNEVISKALRMFGSMLIGAELKEEIEHEREIVLAEFRRVYPNNTTIKKFLRQYWLLTQDGKYWRTKSVLGLPSTVGLITKEDLQLFYDNHYSPANMSVISVGGLTSKEVCELLVQSPFANQHNGSRVPASKIISEIDPFFERRTDISRRTRTTCAFETMIRVPGIIPREVLGVLCRLLNSSLTQELREIRRWVYCVKSVGSSYQDSFYVVSISCEGVSKNNIDSVESIIDDCINRVNHSEDLFIEEIKSARSKRFLFDVGPTGLFDNVLNQISCQQKIVSVEESNREFDSITFDQVISVLPYLHFDKRCTCIVRP